MKKIICIGELSLNIALDSTGATLGAMPGGRIANAAALLAADGLEVLMASEAADDSVGAIVVGHLEQAGVQTRSVDRYTEGRTTLNILSGEPPVLTRYEAYPDEAFDIIWPRIDEGDIVVFGGYYAIDRRMRPRLAKLLTHAVERKALMVYLPGFPPQQESRITRVMPEILENLETAHIVVTRTSDLATVFGNGNGNGCFNDRISFYCRSLVNIDPACGHLEYFGGKECTTAEIGGEPCGSLLWNAGALAGLVAAIARGEYKPDDFEHPSETLRSDILKAAATSAHVAVAGRNQWQLMP